MPDISFHTCTMKINISEQILPLLNIAANEHHLAKLQFSAASLISLILFVFLLQPLTSHSPSTSRQTFQKNHAASPHLTPTGVFIRNDTWNWCCPCSEVAREKKKIVILIFTWFAGECLGRVVTEDDRHSMLFCLPWHPGNVLDVMELSDLKRECGRRILPWMNTATSSSCSSMV